jgi:alcohol dehydrogenase
MLSERLLDIGLRGRIVFGPGAIAQLPDRVRHAGGSRVFVVTDPGVVASGVADIVRRVLDLAGIATGIFAAVEPNPGTHVVAAGSATLEAFGTDGVVIVPVGGGSSMDSAKAISLHVTNPGPVAALDYRANPSHGGLPLVAVPTTAGTGAETNDFGVITDEAVGRKFYVVHPSLLPHASLLDPELTLALPPAATAATGIDAMTHALESLMSRHPNPFAEYIALGVIRTVMELLPVAFADGSNLQARSHLLIGAHIAGIGQASGTGVGLVHAIGHSLGTRGRLPHGTALAAVLPEVLAFNAPVRTRELALVGRSIGVAGVGDSDVRAADATIRAIEQLALSLGQRQTLRELGIDAALFPVIAGDTLDDVVIANAPRQPSESEVLQILASVAGAPA